MLPKLAVPIYKKIIPSTKKEIIVRPFSVKEEKILMTAGESSDPSDLILALKQIVNNCILTEDFDVGTLSYFDFEYLFLQLRSISVGEILQLSFIHNKETCKHRNTVSINLNDIKVDYDPKLLTINLEDGIGIKLKYPTIDDVTKYSEVSVKTIFNLLVDSVDYVFDKDNVYNEFTREEITNFIEDLPQTKIKGLIDFVTTFPVVKQEIKFTCEKCGDELETEVKGIRDFFK
jgi:hypothetical protein